MARSEQRNHFDVPILEYEKLAQIVGTDDYLSVRTGGFINIPNSKCNDPESSINIENAVNNSENIKIDVETEFTNKNLSYIHLLAAKPAKSDLLKLYHKAVRKRSPPSSENIIATLQEPSTEWDHTTRKQFHTIGRALKHCAIENTCKSVLAPSNLDDGSAMSLISQELVEGITINAINNTRSTCTTFAYVQIRLNGQSKDWRAILLCAVMKDPSVSLLIGST